MKITVLTDNTAGSGFLAEHGLSYLIEINEKSILFDTGNTDIFLKNAKQLGLNIQDKVNTIVLSHGHWDHGNGLQFIENKTLITHSKSFIKRYRFNGKANIGLALKKNKLEKKFKLVTSEKPVIIYDYVTFLGEIPRLNDFEAQTTTFIDENGDPDFVPDDSALAIVNNNELTIITGCSHAGICNIISYAMEVTGIKNVKTVIGGFHLKKNNKQTKQTIDYLKKLDIKNIYPSHCTELEALAAFSDAFAISQVKTGMELKF